MASIQLLRGSLGQDHAVAGRSGVQTQRSDRGVVMYGPYEEREPGRWQVEFSLGLAESGDPHDNPICALIEVLTRDGSRLIAERRILRSELADGLGSFTLRFTLHEPRKLEYRIQTNAQAALNIAGDVVVSRDPEAERRPEPRGSQARAWQYEREMLDGYLRNISGLIHVGANYGQERRYYWLLGLDVLWVEPIREVYDELVDNIAKFPRQRAVNALLADSNGQEIEFRIANNGGASSSILPLEGHAELFPDVQYVEHRKIVSTTLAEMITSHRVDLDRYQALTIDTEGAELLVLKGASSVLHRFDYIKCEASDFQSRAGNPSVEALDAVLRPIGFVQIGRRDFGMGPGHRGTNWDVVWKKARSGEPLNEPSCRLPIVFDPHEVHGIEKEG